MRYELFIGLRYLRAKRKQTFISIITLIAVAGVMVGVAALVIVLSAMVGVQEYTKDKILGFNAHVTVRPRTGSSASGIQDYEALRQKLIKLPCVIGASPYIESEVMLVSPRRSSGAIIRGIDPKTVSSVMTIKDTEDTEPGKKIIKIGSLDDLGTPKPGSTMPGEEYPGIALGMDLARSLGAYNGDVISALCPTGSLTPIGIARPKVQKFRVVALFQFGFYEVDSGFALIALEDAQNVFKLPGSVSGIEVKTTDMYRAIEYSEKIKQDLDNKYDVTNWIAMHRPLFAALKMEQLLSSVILGLIILVAALNIISMLVMLVMEKYRDIAILKSMGASDAGVMQVFITQGLIIGIVGTLLGVFVGLTLCIIQMYHPILKFDPEIYQFSAVPIKIEPLYVLLVALFAVSISFLATLYPSWQAARMSPAESLRYE